MVGAVTKAIGVVKETVTKVTGMLEVKTGTTKGARHMEDIRGEGEEEGGEGDNITGRPVGRYTTHELLSFDFLTVFDDVYKSNYFPNPESN